LINDTLKFDSLMVNLSKEQFTIKRM